MNIKYRWKVEDVELVWREYGRQTAAELALRIFGTAEAEGAVYRLVTALGLRKGKRHAPGTHERISELYAQGLPDRVIAARLGLKHDQVKNVRRERFGLPANPDVEGKRSAVRVQFERLGIKSGGELRALAFRRYAVENGWPDDLRPREVQILNALAERGVPMTARELAVTIGMATGTFRTGKRRILLASNGAGGTYTADLIRMGFVVSLGRKATVNGQGRGKSCNLYILGPRALAILEERACRSKTTP